MTIYDCIPVQGVTPEMVQTLLKQAGFDMTGVESLFETLKLIVTSIKQSGKFETVADVLADEEFMNSIKDLIAQIKSHSSQKDDDAYDAALTLSIDTAIRCKKCGHVMTLRQFKGTENE